MQYFLFNLPQTGYIYEHCWTHKNTSCKNFPIWEFSVKFANDKKEENLILITGGCGFIGSNFTLDWLLNEKEPVVVLDKLTYAGNLNNLSSLSTHPNFSFVKGDINDASLVKSLLAQHKPRAVLNFAAESHVDRSIHDPESFIRTNINGTFNLLECAKNYWQKLDNAAKSAFRFLQVSTDEVYGSLAPVEPEFTESNPYQPNNPYSASKAAADHLVRAYSHTYGLPTIITNCSNNYGPYQFPEKMIPLTILNALQGKPLLIYGDGLHIRDWLYVKDHCSAIRAILSSGSVNETFNIGGNNEKTNLDLVKTTCGILDELVPASKPYASLMTHIEDRPGHDRRYAIDATKIKNKIGWEPKESFETGIRKTISWYLNNMAWVSDLNKNEDFQAWLKINYQSRKLA